MSNSTTTVRITVKRRDLATDEHAYSHHEVPAPVDAAERKRQLEAVVERDHPGARLMSFDKHVALFVRSGEMIVAYYADPKAIPGARSALREQRQTTLLDEAA